MDDLVPPAHGLPAGPWSPVADLVAAFVQGGTAGHSDSLRVEGDLLLTTAGAVAAIRLEPGSLLVRGHGQLADPSADVRPELGGAGLDLVQADPVLADVVALMRCGIRGTVWDLWGAGGHAAVAALERAATGDIAVDLGATAERLRTDLVIAEYEAEADRGDDGGGGGAA